MASTAIVPVEEYLRTEYVPRREYVDGVLIEKPRANWEHSMLQGWLGALIMKLFPQYAAGSELHTRLRHQEYRLPDVAADLRSKITGPYPESAVHLCVEILSPEDRLGETFAKCERYHDWGVPFCWVVDPMKRRAWNYAKGDEPRVVESLNAGGIHLELSEVFSILDGPPR